MTGLLLGTSIAQAETSPDFSREILPLLSENCFACHGPDAAHREAKLRLDLVRRWIDAGAEWGLHWSLAPLVRPNVPAHSQAREQTKNPIDAFVRANLAKEKLTPSPEASRHALIRRVTLDLTGLPPTTEDVTTFVADNATDA